MATQQTQRNTNTGDLSAEWFQSVQNNIDRLQEALDTQREHSADCATNMRNSLNGMELRINDRISDLERRLTSLRTTGESDIYTDINSLRETITEWNLQVAKQIASLETKAGVWGVGSGAAALLIAYLLERFSK